MHDDEGARTRKRTLLSGGTKHDEQNCVRRRVRASQLTLEKGPHFLASHLGLHRTSSNVGALRWCEQLPSLTIDFSLSKGTICGVWKEHGAGRMSGPEHVVSRQS